MVQPTVTDVELLKKRVRKQAAGRVLAGGGADTGLDLARLAGCRVRITAGYGALSKAPVAAPRDRLIWVLDGYLEVYSAAGAVTNVSQGECALLPGGTAFRLVFPQLTLYLLVEPEGER